MIACVSALPVVPIDWRPAYRVTTLRSPIALFGMTDDPEELEVLNAQLDAAEAIDLERVPSGRRLAGPDSSAIMGGFVYPGPSRFSDGGFGVYYAAATRKAAFAEVGYHLGRELRADRSPTCVVERVLYEHRVRGAMHRLVGAEALWPGVDSAVPDDYGVSRRLGHDLQAASSSGVVYTSVRQGSDECVGVLDPTCVTPSAPASTVSFVYDADVLQVISVATVQSLPLSSPPP